MPAGTSLTLNKIHTLAIGPNSSFNIILCCYCHSHGFCRISGSPNFPSWKAMVLHFFNLGCFLGFNKNHLIYINNNMYNPNRVNVLFFKVFQLQYLLQIHTKYSFKIIRCNICENIKNSNSRNLSFILLWCLY